MNQKFIISGFSDEIDENIEKQFEHLNNLGISYFEPRGINGKNISELTDKEVFELKATMDKYSIKVSSIGSPIGKIDIEDPMEPHLELLKRVIKTAKILDTKFIRIFSFYIPNERYAVYKDEVMRRMKLMVEIAEQEDVILLHENEKGIYGDIASRCLEIFEELKSPALGCVFDPANFVQCHQAVYPEAYEMLSPYITYMHIKDALADGSVVPAGYGLGSVKNILSELKANNYHGFLSLEPHLGSFTGLEGLETGGKMLDLEHSSPDKFTCAYEALTSILNEI